MNIQKEAPKAPQSGDKTHTTTHVLRDNNSTMQHGASPRRALSGVRYDTRREQRRKEASNS